MFNHRKNLNNPQRWNRYAYSLNNPLKYIDPDGRDAKVALDTGARVATVTVNVLITGSAASPGVAAKFQDKANKSWGGDHKFTAPDGSAWTLKVQVNATTDTKKFTADDKPNTLKADTSGKTEMLPPTQEGGTSNTGTLNVNDLDEESRPGIAGHEVGHMMGLDHPSGQRLDGNWPSEGIMNPTGAYGSPSQGEIGALGSTSWMSAQEGPATNNYGETVGNPERFRDK